MSKINQGLMTSNTDEWATPLDLFQELDREFGFTLDVCADDWNHKTEIYFDQEANGLEQDWTGVCWMNPPYGRQIGSWLKKAYESSGGGGATVVCLVPARTDTAWWHDYAAKGEIRFIRGRIKFVGRAGVKDAAPFPSAIVIFRPERE